MAMRDVVFSDQKAKKICKLVAEGRYTIVSIADIVGVTPPTIYNWLKKYPDFAEEFEKAKEKKYQHYGDIAEIALLKKISGYEYTEKQVIKNGDGDVVREIETTKHQTPSDYLISFTLKNLLSDKFKDKQEIKTELPEFNDIEELKADIRKLVAENGFAEHG